MYRSNDIAVLLLAGSSSGIAHRSMKVNTIPSVSIMQDVLLNDVRNPLRVSIFTTDITRLRHSLRMHGISGESFTLKDCRTKFVQHIFTGSCVSGQEHSNDLTLGTRRDLTACRYFAADFASAKDMSTAAADVVFAATDVQIPKENLVKIVRALSLPIEGNRGVRKQCLVALKRWIEVSTSDAVIRNHHISASDTVRELEKYSKLEMQALAIQHSLEIPPDARINVLRDMVVEHLATGKCVPENGSVAPAGCRTAINGFMDVDDVDEGADELRLKLQIQLLSSVVSTIKAKPLKRLLQLHDIPFDSDIPLRRLRKLLRDYIRALIKGKQVAGKRAVDEGRKVLHDAWPTVVPEDLKDKILHNFRKRTSKEELSSFTCASCAEKCLNRESRSLLLNEIDRNVLTRPDRRVYGDTVVDPD